ncbi:MAG: efflux RND transporter periplasmic adaptor subunit [Rhodospirillales bacterium]
MIKRFAVAALALAVVFGGIVGFNMFRDQAIKRAFAPKEPPPAVVSTAPATLDQWTRRIDAVGTLQAIQSVGVAPQVSGIVTEIAFEPGQRVNRGDVLVRLDDAVERADLKRLEAARHLARLTFDRQRQLSEKQFSSQATVDQAKATLEQAEADIARVKALIDQKTIRAPFAGVLGVREVNLVQFVGPGAKLVGLQSLDALYANLILPERRLADAKLGQTVIVTVDAFRDREFQGRITTIDPQLDQANRTVLAQATVDNPGLLLKPGMFANASVMLGIVDDIVAVPKAAVDLSLYGDSVFVVGASTDAQGKPVRRAERRAVTLGEQEGDRVAVLKGLRAGEEVVVAGQLKLQNNAPVLVDNAIALRPDPSQALR